MPCVDHGDHGTSVSDEIDQRKLARILGFFLVFFPQLILTTRSRDSPAVYWCPVLNMVTMGPVSLMKLTRKQKLVRTLDYFLDFFPQLILTTRSRDSPAMYLVSCVDNGDHGPMCVLID